MKFLRLRQTNKGSNNVVCAREGGANTTLFQVAHFALRNTPKNGGEKEAGKGGAEFPPDPPSAPPALRSRAWGGKRLRHSAVSRISKQKNFLFLLKERRAREKIKKCRENFSVLLSRFVGWAETLGGFLPFTAEIAVQRKFEQRSVIATIRNFQSFLIRRKARSASLARRSARQNLYISALNHTAGEARRKSFCPAGGGSWAQSAQSKSHFVKRLLNAFALQFFPRSPKANTKQVFNPALYTAPSAQWPKATNNIAI